MEKAKLIIHKENSNETVKVQFNPAEYNLTFNPSYSQTSQFGANSTVINFIGKSVPTLSMTLYVDGYQDNPIIPADVNYITKKLSGLTVVDAGLHRPPRCTFAWGSLSFSGVATSVKITNTMFTGDGKAVRARVDITFKSTDDKVVPLESPDRTKRRVLKQDEQLSSMAYTCYRDCEQWRHIALANGLRNPRKVSAGMILRIPALE